VNQETGQAPPKTPILLDQTYVVIREATDKYLLGEEAYRAGDLDRARRHFDAAILAFMTSGLDVRTNPRLKEAYDRIAQDIQSLEAEALTPPEGDRPEEEKAPVEELKDIKSFLTPEELALEMKKIPPPGELDNFSIPVVLNDRVLTLMEAWQTRFRTAYVGGYQRMGRFEPMIRQVLREEGLPEDLIYLAFTESTFKTSAYSRARAKGMWQFMASTGKRYGLTRNAWVDERSDPEKATRAAARYLKDLYGMFDDWYLVLAAYNAGEGLVQKAIDRTGKKDFWDLMQTRYFRAETKNFVPSILALSLMSRDPSGYGFDGIEKDPPTEFDLVTVDGPADLALVARLAGTTVDEIRSLNPELTRTITPPGVRSYPLRVPAGNGGAFQRGYAALPAAEKIASVKLAAMTGGRRGRTLRAGSAGGGDYGGYTVQPGDTLSDIAREFRTTSKEVAAMNGVSERTTLFPGQKLRVPVQALETPGRSAAQRRAAAAEIPSSSRSDAPAQEGAQKVAYRVRSGDNLYRIAQRYGTTVENLCTWNGLRKSAAIYPGDMLTIYAR